jgi:hypothetical protein
VQALFHVLPGLVEARIGFAEANELTLGLLKLSRLPGHCALRLGQVIPEGCGEVHRFIDPFRPILGRCERLVQWRQLLGQLLEWRRFSTPHLPGLGGPGIELCDLSTQLTLAAIVSTPGEFSLQRRSLFFKVAYLARKLVTLAFLVVQLLLQGSRTACQ